MDDYDDFQQNVRPRLLESAESAGLTFDDIKSQLDPNEWERYTNSDGSPGGWVSSRAEYNFSNRADGTGERINNYPIVDLAQERFRGIFKDLYIDKDVIIGGGCVLSGKVSITGNSTILNSRISDAEVDNSTIVDRMGAVDGVVGEHNQPIKIANQTLTFAGDDLDSFAKSAARMLKTLPALIGYDDSITYSKDDPKYQRQKDIYSEALSASDPQEFSRYINADGSKGG